MANPSKFIKRPATDKIYSEFQVNPSTPISISHELDSLESDPTFALFIEALYQDAINHPERLWKAEDVFGADIHGLIEGVDTSEDN